MDGLKGEGKMGWKKIIKNKPHKLTEEMKKDIDIVVAKLMGEPSLIERVKKLLEEESNIENMGPLAAFVVGAGAQTAKTISE